MNWKVIVFILAVFLLLAGIVVFTNSRNFQENQAVPTTQPSPNVENQNTGWKTFRDDVQNITFDYPQDLSTKYIRPQEWPPKITVSSDGFSCNEGGLGINGRPGMTIRKSIDEREYCIESVSEGTAGTFYTDYTYTFLKDNKLIKLEFSLGYPQCDNYEDPQKTECENERQTFDLDSLVDRIAQSVKL